MAEIFVSENGQGNAAAGIKHVFKNTGVVLLKQISLFIFTQKVKHCLFTQICVRTDQSVSETEAQRFMRIAQKSRLFKHSGAHIALISVFLIIMPLFVHFQHPFHISCFAVSGQRQDVLRTDGKLCAQVPEGFDPFLLFKTGSQFIGRMVNARFFLRHIGVDHAEGGFFRNQSGTGSVMNR